MNSLLRKRKSNPELDNKIDKIIEQVKNKQIPEFYPNEMVNNFNMDRISLRSDFIKTIGFTLISNDWIKPLSQWIGNRKCLEVMTGTGSLSFALQQQGIDIIATDNFSWEGSSNWNDNENYWTEIEHIDAIGAVKKYGKDIDIIIMSWPYMDDTAHRILQSMREVNPNCIMIFIGEGMGGCTADDEFFESIQEIEDTEFEQAVSNFKQWGGIHDYPQLVK